MPIPTRPIPEDHPLDEALGLRLEDHLEALRKSNSPPRSADGSELRDLQGVVERLHGLASYLTTTSSLAAAAPSRGLNDTKDYDAAGAASTGLSSRPDGGARDAALPERLGKYQIIRSLGRGGQGSALLAFDPDLQRHVVLKCYHPFLDEQGQRMFLVEGQALARVHSPFVAQVHAAERCDGTPHLVVEYIPGKPLSEVLAGKPLPVDRALQLTRQLAEGLSAIHACGILHRDIKPSNIIVADDGQPRLVDFGLAARLASEELRNVSGTLAYMAPEQARGEIERIDPRTDLFGLGAVLYEMLTGRPPYQAGSRSALLEAARAGDIVPPRERCPSIPPDLDTLCRRCLAKDPVQRYSSATELIQAIDARTRRTRGLWFKLDLRFGKLVVRMAVGTAAMLLVGLSLVSYLGTRANSTFDNVADRLGPPPTIPTTDFGRLLRHDFEVTLDFMDHMRDAEGHWNLREDEKLSLSVQVDRDSYVGVWHVYGGKVVQLFPNSADRDHLIRKGEKRLIPGEKKYTITAEISTGPEHIHVLASTKRWSPQAGQGIGPGGVYAAFLTPESKREWEDTVRGLTLKVKDDPGDGPQVSELIVPFQVRKK